MVCKGSESEKNRELKKIIFIKQDQVNMKKIIRKLKKCFLCHRQNMKFIK